jgi:hypothetical protein
MVRAIKGVMSLRNCLISADQPVADLLEVEAGEILVQIVGRTDELGW